MIGLHENKTWIPLSLSLPHIFPNFAEQKFCLISFLKLPWNKYSLSDMGHPLVFIQDRPKCPLPIQSPLNGYKTDSSAI